MYVPAMAIRLHVHVKRMRRTVKIVHMPELPLTGGIIPSLRNVVSTLFGVLCIQYMYTVVNT